MYLSLLRRAPQEPLLGYMSNARTAGRLHREIVLVSMSSFPLQICASTVQFGGVSTAEFMTANAVVTFVMSFKNVICGHFMSRSLDPHQIALLSALLVFSTVLPTLCTVYVSTQTIVSVLRSQHSARGSIGAHCSEPADDNPTETLLDTPPQEPEPHSPHVDAPHVQVEECAAPLCWSAQHLRAWWRTVAWQPRRRAFRGPRYYALGPVLHAQAEHTGVF